MIFDSHSRSKLRKTHDIPYTVDNATKTTIIKIIADLFIFVVYDLNCTQPSLFSKWKWNNFSRNFCGTFTFAGSAETKQLVQFWREKK